MIGRIALGARADIGRRFGIIVLQPAGIENVDRGQVIEEKRIIGRNIDLDRMRVDDARAL